MGAAAGCSRGDAEQRRRLLQTDDRTRERTERVESQRLQAPDGALLPSTTKIAGIVLPRGFDSIFTEAHAWTFDGNLPQPRVEEYFDKRLTSGQNRKNAFGDVEYIGVREKSDPSMPGVMVRVGPVPARPEWTRIYIGEPVPESQTVQVLGDDALRELMANRRKNAR
jgi:hypothetical protein